jgi:excisionase family DNA binding protein
MLQNATILPADIFTDETAANYVGGIKARAIRDWRTKRGLPFIRITAKVCRIRKTDLDKWLASRRVATMKGAM